jgi:hypothetical protein
LSVQASKGLVGAPRGNGEPDVVVVHGVAPWTTPRDQTIFHRVNAHPKDNRDAAWRRLRGNSGRRNPEAVSWAEKAEHEMLNLTFNVFGIMLTAAAVYGAMDGQIIVPIGFAFAAVSVALFANFVEARGI